MSKEEVKSTLPSVLAVQRGIVITDGIMENILPDNKLSPVVVIRHGIRGTQNIPGRGENVTNVQETDSAKLSPDAIGMKVSFSMRFLPLSNCLSACSGGKNAGSADAFRISLAAFIDRAVKEGKGIEEIALRYARNITNGRWLWRNRLTAERISIVVDLEGEKLTFDGFATPLNQFGDYSDNERKMAKLIAMGMSGEKNQTLINVEAYIDFGVRGAVEVFPSQNYLASKEKGFARSLYKYGAPVNRDARENNVVGFAAIRDQKIGNALRTIDTWYPDYAEIGQPIPVEPNGANLEFSRFFRDKGKASAFDLLKKLDILETGSEDGMFVTAILLRGGVFGESEKTDKKTEAEA